MDANVLIAAFLRDSTVRRIITFAGLKLLAPEVILDEFEEHHRELAQRIGLGSEGAQALLERLRLHLRRTLWCGLRETPGREGAHEGHRPG